MANSHSSKGRSVDWKGVSDQYFKTDTSIRAIAKLYGITESAIRQHAAEHGWVRPTKYSNDDVGRLGSQLALSMISIDGVSKRARCFVAAMVKLEATTAEMAEALEVSEQSLRTDFAKELAGR